MRERASTVMKVLLGGLGLVAVAWLGLRVPFTAVDIPDRGRVNYYKCADCSAVQQFSDVQLSETKAYTFRPAPAASGKERRGLGTGRGTRQSVIRCTNSRCGRYAARVAWRCPKDGEIYIAFGPNDERLGCPKCGTAAVARGS